MLHCRSGWRAGLTECALWARGGSSLYPCSPWAHLAQGKQRCRAPFTVTLEHCIFNIGEVRAKMELCLFQGVRTHVVPREASLAWCQHRCGWP